LEFDTPFAVAAAVAAGLGWAITTPLCLMEADLALDDMQIGPLPAPGLRRRLTLVARHGEPGPLPGQVAALAHDRLRSHCHAFVTHRCPALKDQVMIGAKAY
jgi:DNA-binding transcriptional LysR family regulator